MLLSEHGDIIAEECNGDRIKYTAANSIKAFKENDNAKKIRKLIELETIYKLWKSSKFFKGNIEELELIMKELDVYEKAFILSIAPYIGYDDCCLKDKNNRKMKFDKLVEVSGMSRGKLSYVINSLIAKQIIHKSKNCGNVEYVVNPWLIYKGTKIDRGLKRIFGDYQIKSKDNVKWKDL